MTITQTSIWIEIKPETLVHIQMIWTTECSAFPITEAAHSVGRNLNALSHWALCQSGTLGSSLGGNAASIHMITFLINLPTPISITCPLLQTTLLKEKVLSSINRKLLKNSCFFLCPLAFISSLKYENVLFKAKSPFEKINQWHFYIFFNRKKHIDWAKKKKHISKWEKFVWGGITLP